MKKRREASSVHHSRKDNTSFTTLPHHHHTHILLYFITILLIVLVLVIILSYPLTYTVPAPPSQQPTLEITEASCTRENNAYTICETVVWGGDSSFYVKPYIPGGESLEAVAKYSDWQFTYCQNVGSESGYRVVRAMLFDEQGLVKDIGKGVSCEAAPVATPAPKPLRSTPTLQMVKGDFTAQLPLGSTGRPFAEGTYTKQFPTVVRSCTFQGTWKTDNDLFLRQRKYCHGAEGSYVGYADAYQQYVINDPGSFIWAGPSKPRVNPPEMRYNGTILHMYTCDSRYYQGPRYSAKATVTGFGTKILTFDWEYFDDDTKPHVTFFFEMECALENQ